MNSIETNIKKNPCCIKIFKVSKVSKREAIWLLLYNLYVFGTQFEHTSDLLIVNLLYLFSQISLESKDLCHLLPFGLNSCVFVTCYYGFVNTQFLKQTYRFCFKFLSITKANTIRETNESGKLYIDKIRINSIFQQKTYIFSPCSFK